VRLYAETSAVLAWLMGETEGEMARHELANAEVVVASDLTLIECDRVLIRAVALDEISETAMADRRAVLSAAASHWHLIRLAGEVVERARRSFPREPIRSLDALHLASALVARSALPQLSMLSMDGRVRENAAALGFALCPSG